MATKIIEGQGKQRVLGDGNSGEREKEKIKKIMWLLTLGTLML